MKRLMALVLACVLLGLVAHAQRPPTIGKAWKKKPNKVRPQPRGLMAIPSPTPACICTAAPLDAEETAFLLIINQYRAQNGVGMLEASAKLSNAAKWMSQDMAAKNYFSHTDSLNRDPFTRMRFFGYTGQAAMGENLAAGNESAAATMMQWKNSPGHNANMLNPAYRVIGIGRAYGASSTYRWYWTTTLGGLAE